ncbi:unnamed protein product [Alternaria burnsii]|nr:unnamed protein product [Alternaria burnsii]
MTELLDLTPEIFKMIVHELNAESPSSTWKLRSVCRTFATEIEDNLLSKQPENVVEKMPKVIKNKMAEYLNIHLHKISDVNDPLLKMLRRMADYLIRELAIPEKDRKVTETSMIEGFVRVCQPTRVNTMMWGRFRGIHPLCTSFVNINNDAELDHWQKIVAAMAFLAFDLVRTLLATMPLNTRIPGIYIGRCPLVMAVAANNNGLFNEVMDHLNQLIKTPRGRYMCRSAYAFDDAFYIAVNTGKSRFVKELVEFCPRLPHYVTKETYNKWLDAAIASLNADIVKSVLLLCSSRDKVNPYLFTNACRTGSTDIVNTLLNEGNVDVNKSLIVSFKDHPLCCAIQYGDIPIIGAVLDAGADINGKVHRAKLESPGHTCSPLEMAFERRDKAVIQFLLSKGAEIPPRAVWPRARRLYDVVRGAAIAKGWENVPTYFY